MDLSGNIKHISATVMQHMIHLEDGVKPYRDHQMSLYLTL